MSAIIERKAEVKEQIQALKAWQVIVKIRNVLKKKESFSEFKELINQVLILHKDSISIITSALFDAIKANKFDEVHFLIYKRIIPHIKGLRNSEESSNTLLIHACRYASIPLITLLLNEGCFLDEVNNEGYTPFLYALKHQNKEVVKYLPTKYPGAALTSANGTTVFMVAAEAGNLEMMDFAYSVDPKEIHKTQESGKTPLLFAIQGQSLPAIEFLYKRDPKVLEYNHKDIGTPMMMAAGYNFIPAMEFIVEHDKDALKRCKENGWTPLMSAISCWSINAVEFILKHDSDAAKRACHDGRTPMSVAIDCDSGTPIMRLLLEHDKDALTRSSHDGQTPFLLAIKNGDIALRIFKDVAPEILKRDCDDNHTPLMMAIAHKNISSFEFIAEFDSEAINRPAKSGKTPFMLALEKELTYVMEYILKRDPKPLTIITMIPKIPLQLSTYKRAGYTNLLDEVTHEQRPLSLKYLLSQGAMIPYCHDKGWDKSSHGISKQKDTIEYLTQVVAIYEHIKNGNIKKAIEWLAKGYPLCLRDKLGNNLLHYAMLHKQNEVALYLLEQGLPKDWVNNEGATPFFCAFQARNIPFVIEIFKDREKVILSRDQDEKITEEQIKLLREEFELLINAAKANNIEIDYEILALEFDKKYWCNYAEEVAKLKKTAEIMANESKLKEYHHKKEKLGELIYGGHILCKEKDKGELSFEVPDASRDASGEGLLHSEGIETKNIDESEEARHIRLKWAMKFAMEGQNYASAMRILLETSQAATSVGEVSIPSQKAQNIKSTEDFVMLFMDSTYKPKSKADASKVEAPKVDEPKGDKLKIETSIQGLD